MKSSLKMIKVLVRGNTFAKVFVIIFLLFAVILSVCVAFDSGKYGESDYISTVDLTIEVFLMFTYSAVMLFGLGGIYSSRFFYSLPNSRKLIARTVPTIISVMLFAITFMTTILNAISFSCGIAPIQQISDVLIFSAACTVVTQIFFVSCWYFSALINAFLMIAVFVCEDIPLFRKISIYGFGFSVPAAICIYLAAFAAGHVLSLILAYCAYRRRSTKRMSNVTALRQV